MPRYRITCDHDTTFDLETEEVTPYVIEITAADEEAAQLRVAQFECPGQHTIEEVT